MADNLHVGPCARLSWCRLRHRIDLTDREHLSDLLDLSDHRHRLTLMCWQSERDGALVDQPMIRITYGPIHAALSPSWLDLSTRDAELMAEILGQLTPHVPNDLINALFDLPHSDQSSKVGY
ncbi:hypothetical protein ABZ897_31565 [Nonomuraea sp. NPDC046802]|uniref:hypothetical protein n=1 Tax=Nonomuraea sp. NPDC046802 TaxID=3154919 RepID=UPI0033F23CD0